jgi:hypothetical protein
MQWDKFLIYSVLFSLATTVQTQNLDDRSKTEITLSDSTQIVLYKAHYSEGVANFYYYLPVNLRVSMNRDNPEISLLVFDDDGESGSILHLLLTWGLTGTQEKEANSLLRAKLNDSVLIAGSAPVDAAPLSFVFSGNEKIVGILTEGLRQNSQIPLFPGLKLAASFKFSGAATDEINEMVKNPEKIGDGAVRMIFAYKTMVQQGYITKPSDNELILELNLKDIFKYLQ